MTVLYVSQSDCSTHMDDKVHKLVFVHLFRVEVGDQETYVISLEEEEEVKEVVCVCVSALTSTGFLLRMKKCSALIIMKRMNFLHKIFSISSAWRRRRRRRRRQELDSGSDVMREC